MTPDMFSMDVSVICMLAESAAFVGICDVCAQAEAMNAMADFTLLVSHHNHILRDFSRDSLAVTGDKFCNTS